MPAEARLETVVSGSVQGVGFRFFVLRHANRLGLTGFVRNLPGGRQVHVIAEGNRRQVEELLTALREGPVGAYVENVAPIWTSPTGEFPDFEVRY